jgi:uncharacterized protein YdaU (DUF1376 family)
MTAPTTWMPLDIGDWLADTQELSPEQHGIYLLLCFAYWRNRGPLKNDKKSMQNVSKISWKKTEEILSKFFKHSDGVWHHKRIDEELSKAAENQEKKNKQTAKATAARWSKTTSVTDNPTSSVTDSVTETPLPLPLPSSEAKASSDIFVLTSEPEYPPKEPKKDLKAGFQAIWDIYPTVNRAKGSKKQAETAYYAALSKAPHKQILEGVKAYAAYLQQSGQNNADAFRWLRDERWADDYTFTAQLPAQKAISFGDIAKQNTDIASEIARKRYAQPS